MNASRLLLGLIRKHENVIINCVHGLNRSVLTALVVSQQVSFDVNLSFHGKILHVNHRETPLKVPWLTVNNHPPIFDVNDPIIANLLQLLPHALCSAWTDTCYGSLALFVTSYSY